MKATEVLKKAKELLSIETEEVKLAQATLENGTVIEAETMAAGQEVFIVTEDEKVALPVGEYTLEDGQTLKVEEEGIIASIGAAEEPAEEPAEENLSEESEESEEQVKEEELAEEEKEEMGYATKEELAEVKSMIEEIKAMIDKKQDMSSDEEEVAEEEKEAEEEAKEELSAIPKVKHNPEKETKVEAFQFSNKKTISTLDRVMSKISNIN